jgi:hypothetical protein
MAKLMRVEGDEGMLMFQCPACGNCHAFTVTPKHPSGTPRPCWTWNGSIEKPTFTPSLLVTGTEMTEKGKADYEAWVAAGYPKPAPKLDSRPTRCHSYVTDGRIQFLGDCTHAMAGQTVEIPEWD